MKWIVDELQRELPLRQARVDAVINQLRVDVQATQSVIDDMHAATHIQRTSHQHELAALRSQLQHENLIMNEKVQSMRERDAAREQELQTSTTSLQTHQRTMTSQLQEIAAHQRTIHTQHTQIDQHAQTIAAQQTSIDQHTQTIAALQATLSERDATIHQLQHEQHERDVTHQLDITRVNDKLRTLTRDKQLSASSAQRDMNELKREVKRQLSCMKQIKTTHSSTIHEHEAKIRNLRSSLHELQKAPQRVDLKLKQHTQIIAAQKASIEQYTHDVQRQQSIISERDATIHQLQHEQL